MAKRQWSNPNGSDAGIRVYNKKELAMGLFDRFKKKQPSTNNATPTVAAYQLGVSMILEKYGY